MTDQPLSTGKISKEFHTGQEDCISVRFSADGEILAVGGGLKTSTIELWDVQRGRRVTLIAGHKNSVLKLAISPDKKTVVSGGVFDGVRVWDVASGEEKFAKYQDNKDRRCVGLEFLGDGTRILTMSAEPGEHIRFWDLLTRKELFEPDCRTVRECAADFPAKSLHLNSRMNRRRP